MQRTVSVLLSSFVAGLLLTGCPEKRVEKEDPAMPTASDKNGVEEKAAEKADKVEDEHGDEHGDEAEAPKDDQKPVRKKHADKKAGEEKDQGGW